ncbi:MAG: rubrerythrin family protein [Alistipes sp.]
MKLRPLFILLLFVVSAGILTWLYMVWSREPTPLQTTDWREVVSDLDACCRRKHVKSVQYDHFATQATTEQQRNAAHLFRAMALSARLQENNCATAIVRLGGHYAPPSKVLVFRGTTDSNLQRSITYEHRTRDEIRRSDIDRAVARGNRYAARVLIWAAAGDLRHIALMEHCRSANVDTPTHIDCYQVCPLCGSIYTADYTDTYCPICLTDGRKFIGCQ